nr:MAG TPA: hypothetical protein [Caudoviricetes sp.]
MELDLFCAFLTLHGLVPKVWTQITQVQLPVRKRYQPMTAFCWNTSRPFTDCPFSNLKMFGNSWDAATGSGHFAERFMLHKLLQIVINYLQ